QRGVVLISLGLGLPIVWAGELLASFAPRLEVAVGSLTIPLGMLVPVAVATAHRAIVGDRRAGRLAISYVLLPSSFVLAFLGAGLLPPIAALRARGADVGRAAAAAVVLSDGSVLVTGGMLNGTTRP